MKKLSKLYLLELKNAFKCLARALIALALACILVFGVFFLFIKINSMKEDKALVSIAITTEDTEDTFFPKLLSLAGNIDSLKGICTIKPYEIKDALRALEDGEVTMVMMIPEGFMDKAQHMEEASFTIYLTKSVDELSPPEKLVLELFHSVEQIMMTTEGSILAMYEGMTLYSFEEPVTDFENGILYMFIKDFLNRDQRFDVTYLSKYGSFSVIQYYSVAISILLVCICAAFCFRLYGKNELRLEILMSNKKKRKLLTAVVKVLCVEISMFVLIMTVLVSFKLLCVLLGIDLVISFGTCLFALLLALSLAFIVNFISVIFESHTERVIVYILIILLVALLSGSVGSVYYLPRGLRNLSDIWFFTSFRQSFLAALFDRTTFKFLPVILITDIVLAVPGIYVYYRKLSGH